MLDKVIGQERLKQYILKELENDTLSHGYIIEGNRFMGKTFIANSIAEEITVDSYIVNVLPSEGRKLIQVDDIRTLKLDAYSFSFHGAKKVYIVENSDKMTTSSQNAFLKLLEEPPQDCIFILLAEDKSKLLDTIRSRCMIMVLSAYTDKEIIRHLTIKGFNPSNEDIRLCNGSLNRWEYICTPQFEKDVRELSFRIVLNIMDLHIARIFAITKHLKKIKDNMEDVLDIFLIFYRDLYIYKVVEDPKLLEFFERKDDIIRISSSYTEESLLGIIDLIIFTKTKLEYNSNFDMTIEMLLLKLRQVI